MQENDENLWDYLIDLSLTSKENVEELLKFASQHKIDPIKLIRKVRTLQSQPLLCSLPRYRILTLRLADCHIDPRGHGNRRPEAEIGRHHRELPHSGTNQFLPFDIL